MGGNVCKKKKKKRINLCDNNEISYTFGSIFL